MRIRGPHRESLLLLWHAACRPNNICLSGGGCSFPFRRFIINIIWATAQEEVEFRDRFIFAERDNLFNTPLNCASTLVHQRILYTECWLRFI